jgi:hypothetical protein
MIRYVDYCSLLLRHAEYEINSFRIMLTPAQPIRPSQRISDYKSVMTSFLAFFLHLIGLLKSKWVNLNAFGCCDWLSLARNVWGDCKSKTSIQRGVDEGFGVIVDDYKWTGPQASI